MQLLDQIKKSTFEAIKKLYGTEPKISEIQLQKTRKEFQGDFTLVVFPFLKLSKKKPEQTAEELGNFLVTNVQEIENYNVVKGFLNLKFSLKYWIEYFNKIAKNKNYGKEKTLSSGKTIMIEYSSPNTNKPLHLGHIRNNLLGYSVAEILKANGHKVLKVNLVNDRGIHICKSMLAWQKWGNNETPETTGTKGDKLVGNYYVKFDKEYKKQVQTLINEGVDAEKANQEASLMQEAREMLIKWEAGDAETNKLWKMMNDWVYAGFDVTYKKLGVDFDKIYYESETYKLGKSIALEGLEKGILTKKADNSIWADLSEDGLDEKILLRSDGTSVYMTQDLGTAHQRFEETKLDKHIYVVGNEQNYHFQVLALILQKLGYAWAKDIFHLSYGMVELPEGKMKSREGTVVDADDLMEEMITTARKTSEELGKKNELEEAEVQENYKKIGLGALKYFILKVDPKKNMLFNPQESIDFNGNTGPFIQYSYARIKSLIRKAEEMNCAIPEHIANNCPVQEKEIELIKLLSEFDNVVKEAGKNYSPAIIANYVYDLAKEFNQFYHDFPVLKEDDKQLKMFRLALSKTLARSLKLGTKLLGIDMPEKM